MADLHEVLFQWPHHGPTTVIVTGTFDQWAKSVRLTKAPTGFEASVRIPWNTTIAYKFIVDGKWAVHDDQPTEPDHDGNINNIYTAPVKPPPSFSDALPSALSPDSVRSSLKPTEAALNADNPTTVLKSEKIAPEAPASAPVVAPGSPMSAVEENAANTTLNLPKKDDLGAEAASDFADTVAAREGTSSALGYVASGLGAAIHSVVGVDPINSDKIAIPSPDSEMEFEGPDESMSPVSEYDPPLIAPIVPITITRVYAPEYNTIPREAAYRAPNPTIPWNKTTPKATTGATKFAPKESPVLEKRPGPGEKSTHRVFASEPDSPAVGDGGIADKSEAAPIVEDSSRSGIAQPSTEAALPKPLNGNPVSVVSDPPAAETPTNPTTPQREVSKPPANGTATTPSNQAPEKIVVLPPVSSTPSTGAAPSEPALKSHPEPSPAKPETAIKEEPTSADTKPDSPPANEASKPITVDTPPKQANGTSSEVKEDAPATNGHVADSPATPPTANGVEKEAPIAPATPAKPVEQATPSTSPPKPTNGSSSSSKPETTTPRKRKRSILDKIKHFLHLDSHDLKKKEKKEKRK